MISKCNGVTIITNKYVYEVYDMNDRHPNSDDSKVDVIKRDQARARSISKIVCAVAVVFLLVWFLLINPQEDPIVLLYCLSPLLLLLIVNAIFDYSYKRGKN